MVNLCKTAALGDFGDSGESVSCLFLYNLLILKISGGEMGILRSRQQNPTDSKI